MKAQWMMAAAIAALGALAGCESQPHVVSQTGAAKTFSQLNGNGWAVQNNGAPSSSSGQQMRYTVPPDAARGATPSGNSLDGLNSGSNGAPGLPGQWKGFKAY